jgi:DNA-directed RNA polymerase subunit RPC12/RpoP
MPTPKKNYLVVECSNCKRFLLAASDKKTRTCPYCGKRVKLEDARIAATSESSEEARLALQELKLRERSDRTSKLL